MARKKTKLGCASSLFRSYTSSKNKKHATPDNTKSSVDNSQPVPRNIPPNPHEIQPTDAEHDSPRAVRFIPPQHTEIERPPQEPLSPKSDRASLCSGTSGGSVYLDALEDHPDFPKDDDGNDDFYNSFPAVLIDGQYFFSARELLSPDVLEGIKLYPPIPTTMPDPVAKYPISSSDMKTLLYSYQHSYVKEEEEE